MMTFDLTLFDGHALINENNMQILIDSGAQRTVHINRNFNFLGTDYTVATELMGINPRSLSEMVGTELTTLMGSDILKEYNVLFDYPHLQITFSNEEIQIKGVVANLQSVMGIPVVRMVVNRQERKLFLDTGARISYLLSQFTSDLPSTGTEEDFYPGLGWFQTDCFELETTIGDEHFMVKYGRLPVSVERMLQMTNVDGIIGFDFFASFLIMLDLQNQKLIYSRC